MTPPTAEQQRSQLAEQRRKVDFDTYDVTIDELVRRVAKGRINIAPVYQRQFRWDLERQSRLVESFLLGIPVPPLFMATNQIADSQTQWEVVDGLQRLLSLVNFVGDDTARQSAKLVGPPLALQSLEKLTTLEGRSFLDLSADVRTILEDRPAKVIVLNDKSDLQVRFDLFERINTGGVALTAQEVRECVFRGDFMDLLGELAALECFKKVVILPPAKRMDGTPQDFVLRFFAFADNYLKFDHSVQDFLNSYAEAALRVSKIGERRNEFTATFEFLAAAFPNGIRSRKGTTPVNLFEAVAVGAALALRRRPNTKPPRSTQWISSNELRGLTTGATNSRPRVSGRIEYCRDRFLRAAI